MDVEIQLRGPGPLVRLGSMPRSNDPEILDGPGLPDAIVQRAYRDLDRTHRWLGNTSKILRLLLEDPIPVRSVLDIGCGQGALLRHLRKHMDIDAVGFDMRPPPGDAQVPILTGNAITDELPKADVAVCVCLAHHLSPEECIAMIRNVSRSCRRFIILDLVRHRLPLVLFRTFLAPWLSPVNVQDGCTSVRRAFTPPELRRIADTAVRGTSGTVRHTMAPFYIRQIVDISWAGGI
jgi:SAM-dependent methyltransferase